MEGRVGHRGVLLSRDQPLRLAPLVRAHLVALRAVSSEQVLVLLLLAAAFAAGWIARGRPEFDRSGRSDPAPPPPGPAGAAPPATATGEALIADADAVLARALTAARAAQAMAAGPPGTSAAAVSAA